MKHNKNNNKGFTLIELLVVIAIIAVLSIVVILTLNPAELLKQARDSNRISDLNTMKSAISLYLADVSTVNLGTASKCYFGVITTTTCATWMTTQSATQTTAIATARSVSGNGWIPVAFTNISSGAPIGSEPLDPTNTGNLFYSYMATSSPSTTFKLAAKTESVKYSASGTSDVESTDGGKDNSTYETGTEITM
ncbi:MAG: type II secretion system protein [Patescibacteria group bacterium]|nr:type II secretion system GspH family protein [Patescibacteria group bacterium]MDE2015365.1 type II secretion system protein [Patescibacteria group bacterium]MDE2227020.1 type II secretion system protein [Patescibacteria group bacterium]